MSSPSYTLVIVRRDESLSWLDLWTENLPPIFVYNKNSDPSNNGISEETVARLGSGLTVVNLNNLNTQDVADDATSYLYHILFNSAAVAATDYTVFIHASPFDSSSSTPETLKADLEASLSTSPSTAQPFLTTIQTKEWNDLLTGLNMVQHLNDLFSAPNAPTENPVFEYAQHGCQWIVPRAVIQGRSSNYYKFLVNSTLNSGEFKLEDLWNGVEYNYNVIDIWCMGLIFGYVLNLAYTTNSVAENAGSELVDSEISTKMLRV